MGNGGSEFWNSGRAVSEAADLVLRFVKARGGDEARSEAIRQVGQESKLSTSVVLRFLQPSRQPKSIGVDVWQRLRGAYLAYLKRQLVAIEVEIVRVEALPGADHAAVQGLLGQAEAICEELRRLLL